jgi:hypothetical protein
MGPPENPTKPPQNQETSPWRRRKRPRRRPRTRCCLLKGCEQRFRPRQAGQRYCSAGCRAAARVWSWWKARQAYRATPAGKEKRNGQSRRYRERLRNGKSSDPEVVGGAPRVITRKFFFAACCDRPGCYEGFVQQRRSPLQRFCSHQCRRAMERVWERERRWQAARAQARRGGRGFPRLRAGRQ